LEALYDAERNEDPPEAAVAAIIEHQHALAGRIMVSRVSSAVGIVAIARSVAVSNGNGDCDFQPDARYITGRLTTALMREVCLFSDLPAPSKLAGRTAA
jgi:hypothetical protein